MGISFSADGHFHGVVYLLITLQKRKKETEEAQNVVLMILLEIKFNVAVRLVAILDTICQQKKEPGAQPRSQGPLSFSFLEVEKPLERGCQGQGFCELFTRAFSLQILFFFNANCHKISFFKGAVSRGFCCFGSILC